MDIHLVCELADRLGWGGRVAIGHGNKYSCLPPAELEALGRRLAASGVAVTVLQTTDLFTSGRHLEHSVIRGVADANALIAQGANCSIATNNVLNPFTPYGDCSLVRIANLYANVVQRGTIDPQAVSPIRRLQQPSAEFWFGSDMLGRDVYSRVVYGARVSLAIGIAVAVFSTLVGLAIGLVTGFIRWLDAIVMRIMDGLMSIPPVLLAIALMALTKASIENVILAITLAEVPRVVRLGRSLVLSLREEPYVEAAIAAGTSLPRILLRHILPNTAAPLLVQGTYVWASAMITEAILSFIGAGTPPNIPSWGNIMAEARSLFQIAGYLILFPGVCL